MYVYMFQEITETSFFKMKLKTQIYKDLCHQQEPMGFGLSTTDMDLH